MSTPLTTRPEKIHALTSLRFFAAFWVVLFHTVSLSFRDAISGTIVEQVLSLGYISVSFFFLLSGYILAMVYLRDGATVRKANFYVARFARVYPLFFLTLIADTPFVLSSRTGQFGLNSAIFRTGATFGAHVLMLQAWLPGLRGIDQPNWSLSVETLFYLIFPFIGVLLWRTRGATLWLAAAVIWILSQVAVWLVAPHVSITTVKFFPLLHVGTFALGILLARWQQLQRAEHGSSPKTPTTLGLGLLTALVMLAAAIYWSSWLPLPNLNAGLLCPAFALIVWACSGSSSLPSRLLSAKWLVILGEASFGLYLIHIPVLHVFEAMHWERSRLLYPVYLSICIGLSVISFYLVETPTRKWILRQFQTRPRETMEAASDAQ
jgi:peptidoglycan/LPS O-acetylase OafA/YrhL